MNNKKGYFKADLIRIISIELLIIPICMAIVMFVLGMVSDRAWMAEKTCTIRTYSFLYEDNFSSILFIIPSFAYSFSFIDDFEHKYIEYELIRGAKTKLIVSRLFVVYLSAFAVNILGSLLFLLINNFRLPFYNKSLDAVIFPYKVGYDLYVKKLYFLFTLSNIVYRSLFVGLFALLVALASVWLLNKGMAVLIIYSLSYIWESSGSINVSSLYIQSTYYGEIMPILLLFITVIFITFFGVKIGIERRMGRWLT